MIQIKNHYKKKPKLNRLIQTTLEKSLLPKYVPNKALLPKIRDSHFHF